MKTLFIGQAPGRPRDEDPMPHAGGPLAGPSGNRLASLLGISWKQFQARFQLVNLIQEWPGKSSKGDAFPRAQGTIAAQQFLRSGMMRNRKSVLLGQEVGRCFRIDAGYFEPVMLATSEVVMSIPHPSGVNRWWNEQRNVAAAEKHLKWYLESSINTLKAGKQSLCDTISAKA